MSSGLGAELKQNQAVCEPRGRGGAEHCPDIRHSRASGFPGAEGPWPDLEPYNVLRILRGAGPEGLCRNEVGARLVTQVPDVTRLLDRMEDTGLISRQRGAEDRRFVTTRITRKGLELVDKLDEPVRELLGSLLGHMSRRGLRALIDGLAEARVKP